MNNYKYYGGSLAYDFDMFETSPAKKQNKSGNIIQHPSVAKQAKKKARQNVGVLSGKLSAVVMSTFIILMLFANIYSRAEVSATRSQINDVNQQIEELYSEHVSLSCSLENKMSYKNLEAVAVDLGMQKVRNDQIVYVKTNNEDQVVCDKGLVLDS
ncbi:MAG: hypothetical protein Q4B04_04045 [bacterium]|nr:hypothetical protein [bacterium]